MAKVRKDDSILEEQNGENSEEETEDSGEKDE